MYNRPEELDELLASVLIQEYDEVFDVYVIEDGSSVKSDFIVEKYKSGFVLKDLNKVNFEIILNANFKKQKLIEGANQYFSLEKGVISYLKIYRKIC